MLLKALPRSLVALTLILATSCASWRHKDPAAENAEAAQPQTDPTQIKIDGLTGSLAKAQTRIEELEAKIASMNDSLEGTKLALENITGPKETRTEAIGENADGIAPEAAHAAAKEAHAPALKAKSKPRPAPALAAAVNEEEPRSRASNDQAIGEFTKAMNLLRKGGYADAVLSFNQFVEIHPEHALAGSAQFYAGESYFQMGEYKLAVAEYQKVLSSFSSHPRAASALVRIAHSYAANGNEKEAARYMGLAQTGFPGNPSLDWPAPRVKVATAKAEPMAVAPKTAAPVESKELEASPMEMSKPSEGLAH